MPVTFYFFHQKSSRYTRNGKGWHGMFFSCLILILTMQGCYVNKILPDENLSIEEGDKIVSYKNLEGNTLDITPEGFEYRKAMIEKDTLRIDLSASLQIKDTMIIIQRNIPLSEIQSLQILPEGSKYRYGSFGMGAGSGFILGGAYTAINHHTGVSGSVKMLWYKALDLPSDYTGIYNFNNMNMISLTGIFGGKPGKDGNVWLGLELGPSLINCRKEVETLNPNYNPTAEWWKIGNHDKYIRDNIITTTMGLFTRIKLNFMGGGRSGFEVALFGNFNDFKSITGIEFIILFGKVN